MPDEAIASSGFPLLSAEDVAIFEDVVRAEQALSERFVIEVM